MPYTGRKSERFSIWDYLPRVTLSNERPLIDLIGRLPSDAVIVDVGSGGRLISPDVITVDKYVVDNTKVVADIHFLPFKDSSVDCVICSGTLEHVEDPWKAVEEFHRILKQGGKVYVDTPFMQGYHPDPEDYWRFTERGLQRLLRSFRLLDSGCLIGSGSGLQWALVDTFRACSDNKYLSESLGILARAMFFWVKYFDRILKNKRNNRLFASGFYCIGEKSQG